MILGTRSIDSVKLQLSRLIQLTQTTNQLTRTIPYENVLMVDQQLLQCAANVLTKIIENRNRFYQQKSAKVSIEKVDQIIVLVTSSSNIPSNIEQKMIIDAQKAFISLEKISFESLLNKLIQQVGDTELHLSSNVTSSIDKNSNTNLSTMISLPILDRNGNEMPFRTPKHNPARSGIP
ncbi:unnamed protein product [Adineta ricciae]|uniref:Uncharacterized protein n=1 Tax=Adineta ricciae TaxID=249248 RepID=A0A814WB23_ADIRI|nr:unnamed protein product [Adineta ricciae]CAF1198939.1 unnamed protein product [Adineta ricciae]